MFQRWKNYAHDTPLRDHVPDVNDSSLLFSELLLQTCSVPLSEQLREEDCTPWHRGGGRYVLCNAHIKIPVLNLEVIDLDGACFPVVNKRQLARILHDASHVHSGHQWE